MTSLVRMISGGVGDLPGRAWPPAKGSSKMEEGVSEPLMPLGCHDFKHWSVYQVSESLERTVQGLRSGSAWGRPEIMTCVPQDVRARQAAVGIQTLPLPSPLELCALWVPRWVPFQTGE